MDVIVPGHHVRLFCSSLVCASRIGKDLYLEFDPVSGLNLRSLNDAKSAYVCFRYQPHFFQRCTTATATSAAATTTGGAAAAARPRQSRHYHNNRNMNDRHKNTRSSPSSSQKSLSPSSTVPQQQSQDTHQTPSSSTSQSQQGQQDQSPPTASIATPLSTATPNNQAGSSPSQAQPSQSQSEKFICRVSLRALTAVVRQRKNIISLRIRSEQTSQATKNQNRKRKRSDGRNIGSQEDNGDDENDYDEEDEEEERGTLYLTFEFIWQASTTVVGAAGSSSPGSTILPTSSHEAPWLRILHRIPVASIPHVSAAVANREHASELQAHPGVLLQLLDPLKRTAEAALIVRADLQRIHASSFHQSTATTRVVAARRSNNTFSNNHALLQTSDSLLKTETGIACDELYDFFYRQDRPVDHEDDNDDDKNHSNSPAPPSNVNQIVVLVFPIKEAKAFLQFATTNSSLAESYNMDPTVNVFFHWGGKPIIWQVQQQQQQRSLGALETTATTMITTTTSATTSAWKGELILATLDHRLLGTSMDTNELASAAADKTSRHRRGGTGAGATVDSA
ncbi:hypothetical protein ACA910_010747 [Epithemia clementina (nom. ined.)]